MKTRMRDLAVVRSATVPVRLFADAPPVEANGHEPRAVYRAEPSNDALSVMTVGFSEFGVWYEIDSYYEGRFLERIAPGAFIKTIAERAGQVKVLFNHGMEFDVGDKILGPISLLEERANGPYGEVPLLDTSYNRDLIPGLRAKVYGSSFMFNVIADEWNSEPGRSDHNPDGIPERTIREVRLLEFGPVTWPANPAATAGLRSNTDHYADRLRARSPERYGDFADQYADFRTEHRLGADRQQITISNLGTVVDEEALKALIAETAGIRQADPAADDPGTSATEAAVDDAEVSAPDEAAERSAADDTSEDEAAHTTTTAPDEEQAADQQPAEANHATGLSPDQRAAQLRGLDLLEIS